MGSAVLRNKTVSNISIFDRPNLNILFSTYPDGSPVDVEYVMTVQKLMAEFFSKGDPLSGGLPYRFPVLTVNLSVDEQRKPLDEDFLQFVARTNTEKGVYNIYANEGTKIATCCRLVNNLSRMEYRTDSFGNGGLNIGSHRVVTINFARLALDANGIESEFFKLLDYRLKMCRDLLVVHREEILERRIRAGFLKFFKPLNWMSLSRFFSTIGIHALFEMCHYMNKPMQTPEGIAFTQKVLNYVEDAADEFSKEHGYSFNSEEIPAESAAVSFATKDALTYNQPFALYSNQYIPLIADVDPIERIELSGKFMNMVSGGGILHINLLEKIPNAEIMEKLILRVLEANVPHFAVNYGFGLCENGHTVVAGNSVQCPLCQGKITDYLTRIIGYFTKVNSWNEVRRTYEYPRRKFGEAV